jgi:hypothetical protein
VCVWGRQTDRQRATVSQLVYRISYWVDNWDSIPGIGRDFFSPPDPDRPRDPSSLLLIPGALSPGVQRPGSEADHSPPSSAEVKNAWSYTSTPKYFFIVRYLVKHRNNVIFTSCKKTVYSAVRSKSLSEASNTALFRTVGHSAERIWSFVIP